MPPQEVHLELLLGKTVRDAQGKRVGRIEEVRAEQQGDAWFVQEYLVGTAALLERLSAMTIGLTLLRFFGARQGTGSYKIPWDKLDLSDPDKPSLCCDITDLQEFRNRDE